MATVKSRSKITKRYAPTAEVNQKFPKPPRYFMGVLFTGDERILFDDAIFYHLSENTVKIVNRDPKNPFDGECEVEAIPYKRLRDGDGIEIDEIQYSIGIVTDDDKYVYRLFNHECDEPALLYLDDDDNLILEASMETDSSKEVMGVESPYPVTQFIN
jgi:hypothetical protein